SAAPSSSLRASSHPLPLVCAPNRRSTRRDRYRHDRWEEACLNLGSGPVAACFPVPDCLQKCLFLLCVYLAPPGHARLFQPTLLLPALWNWRPKNPFVTDLPWTCSRSDRSLIASLMRVENCAWCVHFDKSHLQSRSNCFDLMHFQCHSGARIIRCVGNCFVTLVLDLRKQRSALAT